MSGSASIWAPSTVINSTANADNSYLTQVFATPTVGQTLFNLTGFAYSPGTASLDVFVNGVRQNLTTDYLETSPNSFTFTSAEIETTDVVVAVGKVGLTGATNAAASAAASAASAAAALATYNAILALSLPALPLTIANGGTGTNTRQGALDALAGVTTKGDLLVRTAANLLRLGVGADGYQLTADSTAAAGMSWIQPSAIQAKILANASTDTLQLTNNKVNINYGVFSGATIASYAVTGYTAFSTILRISALRGSVQAQATNGVFTNFQNSVDLLLTDASLPQGLWSGGTINYGRTRTLTGAKYGGSYMLDATTAIIIEYSTTIADTFYIHVVNLTTGAVNTTTYTGANLFSTTAATNGLPFFNIYPNGASAFILTLGILNSTLITGANRAALFTCTVAAGVATVVNAADIGANIPGPAYNVGVAGAVFPLTATVFAAGWNSGTNAKLNLFSVAGNVITTGATSTIALVGSSMLFNVLPSTVGGNPGLVANFNDDSITAAGILACSYNAGTLVLTPSAFISSGAAGPAAPGFNSFMYAVPGTTDHFIMFVGNSTTNGTSAAGFRLTTLTAVTNGANQSVNTSGAADLYGMNFVGSLADKAAAYRTDAYKPYVWGGYTNGADNVLISPASMIAITSLTTAYAGASSPLTVGNRFNAASTACKVLNSAITGIKYYTDNNVNLTKQFTPAVPTFASGTTLIASYLGATVWAHENLFGGNYYNVAGGVATFLSAYALINTSQPDAIIGSGGKAFVQGVNYIDGVF